MGAFEDGVEVEGVAVDQTSGLDAVLIEEVHLLQLLQGAPPFEVKHQTLRHLAQTKQ